MATEAEVMEMLGRTLFAAQNFETNLGSLLLMATVHASDQSKFQDEHGNQDVEAVQAFLDKVDGLTLGQLKGQLQALGILERKTIDEIASLNDLRRRLVHYFVLDYQEILQTSDGRDQVLFELSETHRRLRTAWFSLQELLTEISIQHGYTSEPD